MRLRNKKLEILRCSFCGKSQSEVKKLIAGPKVYICNECVGICAEIIGDDVDLSSHIQSHEPTAGQARVVLTNVPPRVRCSMCRTFVMMSEALSVAERGHLCPACEAAVRVALDEVEAYRTED